MENLSLPRPPAMSGHDDAPAIKLYANKKEQETYENLAGLLSFSPLLTLKLIITEVQQQIHVSGTAVIVE